MTTNDVRLPQNSVQPFAGQATMIEQSRAVAEVQAMVVVAQQMPRNVPAALAAMRESCAQMRLAERAFFRYPRAGEVVTGESIHLARELARCWGNLTSGMTELRRDDDAAESEILAYAWDVQTNTRTARIVIVKHARDTKKGRRQLVELRDITENNTNIAARQLREAIFNVLPPWFVEEAKDLCMATLRDGGGKPMATQVADAVKAFAGKGITVDQLERKQGRPTGQWTEHDVAALRVVYTSIDRGEVTIAEEFEPAEAPVTKAEIDANAAAALVVSTPEPGTPESGVGADEPATGQPASAEIKKGQVVMPEAEPVPVGGEHVEVDEDVFARPMSPAQSRRMHAQLRELGVTGRGAQLELIGEVLGRVVPSRKALTVADGVRVNDELRVRLLRLGEFADDDEPDDDQDDDQDDES